MKERPILFNSEMVRAILDGRKTQTRRPVKPSPGLQREWLTIDKINNFVQSGEIIKGGWQMWHPKGGPRSPYGWVNSPFGETGDRLWVRETSLPDFPKEFSHYEWTWAEVPVEFRHPKYVLYRADGFPHPIKWHPSIHMPRWASRITLEITNVRVERLQDISEADARAEGAKAVFLGHSDPEGDKWANRAAFKDLWNSVYDNYAANPWVWVIEFKRTPMKGIE